MKYNMLRVAAEKQFSEDLNQLFNADLLRTIIREAKVESTDNFFHTLLRGHSFKITPELTPGLHKICQEVKATLNFTEDIEFFIESSPDLNAAAIARVETDQPHLVIIHSAIIERFNDEELRFLIGHEIGHLISRNSELQRVVGFVFPPGTNVSTFLADKLETWGKLSELTADRFGYIAIPDLSICRSVFFKLASGLDVERIQFSEQAFQESMDEILEFFRSSGQVLESSHPVNPIRLKALQFFAESDTYAAISADKDLAADAQLAEELDGLTKIVLNKGNSPLSAHRKRFLAAGGMLVAGVDSKISETEVERIIGTLAAYTHFPRKLLDDILAAGDVMKTFQDSLNAILAVNPGERYSMFEYLVEMAMADHSIAEEEVDLLFQLGEGIFGFQKKEVAQKIAAALQKDFIPNFLGRSNISDDG